MLCGVGPYHIRALCEPDWEGGRSYTPQQVGEMTLDQIFMLFADKKILRSTTKTRTTKTKSVELKADKDGYAKGRDKEGNVIRARVGGKSKARMLMEQEEEKKKKEREEKRRRKRKRTKQKG